MSSYEHVHRKRHAITRDWVPNAPAGGRSLEVAWCGFLDDTLRARGWDPSIANWNPNEPVTSTNFDIEAAPWPHDPEKFELVIACEVLEHLPNDPMALFAEANRVLKPGGHILLTTPNMTSSRGVEAMLQGYSPYLFCTFPRTPCDRHVIEYDKHQLALMLRSAGFAPTIWTEDCWSEPNQVARDILKRHGFPLDDRGDNLFTLSRKIGPVNNRKPDGIYHD